MSEIVIRRAFLRDFISCTECIQFFTPKKVDKNGHSYRMSTMSSLDKYDKHALKAFIESHRCQRGEGGAKASMCGTEQIKGSFYVPDEDYDEFLDLMHDYLFVKKGRPINFVEQPILGSPKPILVDMDFKFALDSNLTHQFDETHTRAFVGRLLDGLKYFFDLPDRPLRFFVSSRPQAYKETTKDGSIAKVKDGIHIQCPDMCIPNEKQAVLRNWLLQQKAIDTAFDGVEYVNDDPSDIYDEALTRKQGWFFHGESKMTQPAYKIDSVFVYDTSTETFSEEDPKKYTNRELMTLLSIRYKLHPDTHPVLTEREDEYQRLLPAKLTSPVVANATSITSPTTASQQNAIYIPEAHDEEEIIICKRLAIECLSAKRATDYKTWIETGWCLSNIDHSDEMFQVWVSFSMKSPKAGETDWAKYKRSWSSGFSRNSAGAKLTIKSLHYWAREDAPEKYKEIIEDDTIRYVQFRVNDTHHHCARILQRMYKQNFCASIENRKIAWYIFDEKMHTWRHINQGMELREKLSFEVAALVIAARERLKKKGQDEMAETNPDKWFDQWIHSPDGERFKMLTKLETHLYSSDFKNCVMKEAAELFSEEDFTQRLNLNQYLIPCQNGVIDLRTEVEEPDGSVSTKIAFRPGKPDDFMSFMVGRNVGDMGNNRSIYYTPYNAEDPMQIELMDFLKKIFTKDDLLWYVIRLMASCLEGANREQCYYTFIGVGGNGKSKLVDLMRFTFGDFSSSLQATALTRKRPDSGAANPDIVAIKNKRFIYLQEPDDKEPLNTSRMKQFSGEDVVEARGLFEDQQRFRITGKLFMMCNRYPPIHSMDKGTWRRIRVITFGSEFVENSDPRLKNGTKNIFARDKDLDRKLMRWREAWLSLLVHVYETQYMVRGLEPIPESVLEQSNKYKESFDMYGKFKAERMVDFRNPKQKLTEFGDEEATIKDMTRAYTKWTKANEGILSGNKLSKQELQNRLDEDFGTLQVGVYKRVKVFDDEDDMAVFVRDRSEELSPPLTHT
jgi:P4 family phage/plasmid primase-like protien